MSEENLEIVRQLAEAFRRRDHERVFEFYDPEIEWDATRVSELIPDAAEVFHGHEGVRTYWRRWLSAWKDLEFETEFIDAGDDVVMLVSNQRQWGRTTGIETQFGDSGSGAMTFTIRDGKVVAARLYVSQDEARRAVGLGD